MDRILPMTSGEIFRIQFGEPFAMQRYLSRRHKRLMDESELALLDAAGEKSHRESRIARHVLGDPKTHRIWEASHAELVRPVAEQKNRAPQVLALRGIEIRLIHKRALVDHMRAEKLREAARNQMLSALCGPTDINHAIITEHRQYMLAVSSNVSTDHLIDVMQDPIGTRLLKSYRSMYMKYFELYGYVLRSNDAELGDALRPLMRETLDQLARIRKRVASERPGKGQPNFDKQALLARSGRHPMREYMVG